MKLFRLVAVVLGVAGWLTTSSPLHAAYVPMASDDAAILPYLSERTSSSRGLDVDRVDPKALDDDVQKATKAMFGGAEMPKEQRAARRSRQQAGHRTAQEVAGRNVGSGRKARLCGGGLGRRSATRRPGAGRAGSERRRRRQDHRRVHQRRGLQRRHDAPHRRRRRVRRQRSTGSRRRNRQIRRRQSGRSPGPGGGVQGCRRRAAPRRAVPGEPTRSWVESNLPSLPQPLGGGETQTLSRGVKYATIAIRKNPRRSHRSRCAARTRRRPRRCST